MDESARLLQGLDDVLQHIAVSLNEFRLGREYRIKEMLNLSTPEQKCIGLPERKYINDSGKKASSLLRVAK
jgi:hypothetical protein